LQTTQQVEVEKALPSAAHHTADTLHNQSIFIAARPVAGTSRDERQHKNLQRLKF
jgi:hypothetical protein